MIIALHSFKGGTGKTVLAINLATMLAKKGKKTCLVELDFSAPSFFATFKHTSKHWVNDYLNKACSAESIIADCSTVDMGKGKLFVALADPSTEAIRDMASKDRKWEIEALGRLLALRDVLTKEMEFDYVFFDTSPGLQYSSINAIVVADVVIIVSSTDKSDVEGTRRMTNDLYDIFSKKTAFIANKVPSDSLSSPKIDRHKLHLLGVVPCSCDVPKVRIRGLFAPENPDHVFTKKLREIAENIEQMCCSEPCSFKFDDEVNLVPASEARIQATLSREKKQRFGAAERT
jgi:MinD-like ATPase involved in chromosome partitioning or flagellar assembly